MAKLPFDASSYEMLLSKLNLDPTLKGHFASFTESNTNLSAIHKNIPMPEGSPEPTTVGSLPNPGKSVKPKKKKNKLLQPSALVSASLVSALRCQAPRCSGFVYAPASTCGAGHALCLTCAAWFAGRCPLCTEHTPRAIAFHLEEKAEKLLSPCSYRQKGCHFRFPEDGIAFHQMECRFAPKRCFSSKCDFFGDNKDLASHMERSHSERVIKGVEAEYSIKNFSKRTALVHVQYISCQFGDFWVKYVYSETDRQLYGAVQYIGPQQEAEKLEYEFEMREYCENQLTGF